MQQQDARQQIHVQNHAVVLIRIVKMKNMEQVVLKDVIMVELSMVMEDQDQHAIA